MNAAISVQKAIFDTLIGDQPLLSILGGRQVFDGVPDHSVFPYLVFSKIESDDWSTGTEAGEEHLIEIIAWSSAKGRKEVGVIVDAVKAALKAMPKLIDGHHLINFTWETTTSNRTKDNRFFTASSTFRAVTEPITE
ncbi:MAG: DUF3168 domain-containing protein [Salaquimonas sp.]